MVCLFTKILILAFAILISASGNCSDACPERYQRLVNEPKKGLNNFIPKILGDEKIHELSERNLRRLEAKIASRIAAISNQEAADYLKALPSLKITHSTSPQAALRILDEGKVKSAIRAGKTANSGLLDQEAGETNMVFLAIETGKYRGGHYFGEVTFSFSDDLLEDGYFSPFALVHGNGFTPTFSKRDQLQSYKSNLFTGKEAFEKMKVISAKQVLWEEKQPWFKEASDLVRQDADHFDSKIFFEGLGESKQMSSLPLSMFPSQQVAERVKANLGMNSKYDLAADPGFPLISAFTRFPSYTLIPNGTLRSAWFWELKIPEAVDLNRNLKEIRIVKNLSPVMQIEDKLEKLGLKFRKKTTAKEVILTIIR